MNPKEAGRVLRSIRQRQGKRLLDVAEDAHLSRSTVSLAERGAWDGLTYRTVVSIVTALEARISVDVSWRGAELDRVLDERHARLVGLVVERLRAAGWVAKVEVSYSIFGERGSIDVLGWHASTGSLAVFEIKTELGSVEGLLRPLDAKARLAARIAREQFGWRAARVTRIVVFPEDRTVRRRVERHRAVLDQALPATNVEVRAWLMAPTTVLQGRWFLTDSRDTVHMRNPSAVRRVRRRSVRADEHGGDPTGEPEERSSGPKRASVRVRTAPRESDMD